MDGTYGEVSRAVDETLAQAERIYGIKVLFAVESGSRAWGFASTDSDFDVRFVYCHGVDHYLSLAAMDQGDTIEPRDLPPPADSRLDVSGWELRKALRLLKRSNPSISEWLSSPHVYSSSGSVLLEMAELRSRIYSRRAGAFHYYNLARGNYESYISGKGGPLVSIKKYFYVLRGVVGCLWLQSPDRSAPPPLDFESTFRAVCDESDVREVVLALLRSKRSGAELGLGRRIDVLDRFIEDFLSSYDPGRVPPSPPASDEVIATADRIFRSALLLAPSREALLAPPLSSC